MAGVFQIADSGVVSRYSCGQSKIWGGVKRVLFWIAAIVGAIDVAKADGTPPVDIINLQCSTEEMGNDQSRDQSGKKIPDSVYLFTLKHWYRYDYISFEPVGQNSPIPKITFRDDTASNIFEINGVTSDRVIFSSASLEGSFSFHMILIIEIGISDEKLKSPKIYLNVGGKKYFSPCDIINKKI